MEKILWTIYLVVMLFMTIMLIMVIYSLSTDKEDPNGTQVFFIVITPILWAIWYMYYLN